MKKNSWWMKGIGRTGGALLSCLIASQMLTAGGLLPGETAKAEAAAPAKVSTWMWNPYVIGNEREATLQQLTDHKVNQVFLFIDPEYPAEYYSRFIREAGLRGIEVQALDGAPNWVLPEHNKKMYAFIYWVKQYNAKVQPEERFTGIHLDVEPYVLAQWRQDSDKVMGLWMDTVSGFAQEVKAETGLTVAMDMPVWAHLFQVRDGAGGRTTLSNWMIRWLDQVTLMSYSDNAKDIEDSVKIEMAEADRTGVKAQVAVDTVDSGEDGTFYGKGTTAMNRELNAAVASLSSHSSFRGYSVHAWDNWRKLSQ